MMAFVWPLIIWIKFWHFATNIHQFGFLSVILIEYKPFSYPYMPFSYSSEPFLCSSVPFFYSSKPFLCSYRPFFILFRLEQLLMQTQNHNMVSNPWKSVVKPNLFWMVSRITCVFGGRKMLEPNCLNSDCQFNNLFRKDKIILKRSCRDVACHVCIGRRCY